VENEAYLYSDAPCGSGFASGSGTLLFNDTVFNLFKNILQHRIKKCSANIIK
jgi:hypothetical protein